MSIWTKRSDAPKGKKHAGMLSVTQPLLLFPFFLVQGVVAVVRAAVKAAEDQILASLSQEASLLSDILQLKLQQAALTTRGLQNPVSSSSVQQEKRD